MRMYVPLLVHKLVKQNKGGVGSKNKEAQILCTEKSLWLCANGFFGCWITQKFKKKLTIQWSKTHRHRGTDVFATEDIAPKKKGGVHASTTLVMISRAHFQRFLRAGEPTSLE